ncbi:hypothetical protein SNEBB_002313 [Seison nebaliae]|nr:hypothetical protein SNEBB_002313 [Seison nebaliae]
MYLEHQKRCEVILNEISGSVELNENNGDIIFTNEEDEEAFQKVHAIDKGKNRSLENVIRRKFLRICQDLTTTNRRRLLLNLWNICIRCVYDGIVGDVLPIILLHDLYSCSSLDDCEEMFFLLEKYSIVWKKRINFSHVQNNILRLCNDLLKQFHKIDKNNFCGKIQMFLANLFPLNERSALNPMGAINVENVTHYIENDKEFEKDIQREINLRMMTHRESDNKNIPFGFYMKFWSIQKYFYNPHLLNNRSSWLKFVDSINETLQKFHMTNEKRNENDKHYLNQLQFNMNKSIDLFRSEKDVDFFSSKYLTSASLLARQFEDVTFQRNLLIQFLIFFQYFHKRNRHQTNIHLWNEQQQFINSITKLIKFTLEHSSNNFNLVLTIDNILEREQIWNEWKLGGCVSFLRKKKEKKNENMKRKRTLGEDVEHQLQLKYTKLGNVELDQLWNYRSDNLLACQATPDKLMPNNRDYFEEAIMQSDPSSGIEKEYLLIKQPQWAWKALRLLSYSLAPYVTANNKMLSGEDSLKLYCEKQLNEKTSNKQQSRTLSLNNNIPTPVLPISTAPSKIVNGQK